jgi:hypothetical protein
MQRMSLTNGVILIVGERRDRAPIGLAGLLSGHTQENTSNAARASFDIANEERDWVHRFGRFCLDRGRQVVWLCRMSDAQLAVRYERDGPTLTFRGCGELEGSCFGQDAIQGVWYRGLPALSTFASEDEQTFAERETEAFWEGYGYHVRLPVLNRPRTAGLRPATWENFLVRYLVADQLGLTIPQQGVIEPRRESSGRVAGRIYQTLSTRTLLEPDCAAGAETCAWIESRRSGRIAVCAVHVGDDVVLSRQTESAAEPLSPGLLSEELARSLEAATAAVGRLLGESFGAVFWDVDPRDACFDFRDYTTNPDGRILMALRSHLFSSIWRFFMRSGGAS